MKNFLIVFFNVSYFLLTIIGVIPLLSILKLIFTGQAIKKTPNIATLLDNLEHALQLKILGDGVGHFEVQVTANDNPDINSSNLSFTMAFDQTEIKNLVNQLDKITKAFPITGDFKIKNT